LRVNGGLKDECREPVGKSIRGRDEEDAMVNLKINAERR